MGNINWPVNKTYKLAALVMNQKIYRKCANDLSGSVSSFFINKCNDPAQLNPQALIYCSNSGESRVSEDLNSSKHAIMECGMANPTDNSAPLQEMARCESQDVISSAHSGKQLVQFPLVSSNIQVERPTDPAALTSIQCPPAGMYDYCYNYMKYYYSIGSDECILHCIYLSLT